MVLVSLFLLTTSPSSEFSTLKMSVHQNAEDRKMTLDEEHILSSLGQMIRILLA